ncbi:MAG: peptide chain release factor N(5)-glutamine methyltransferase [Planctomycetota bacterium]
MRGRPGPPAENAGELPGGGEGADIAGLLSRAQAELGARGLPTPGLDAELLLAAVLGVERARLRVEPDIAVPRERREAFQRLLAERRSGRPVAYLLGEWEFYGVPLTITPAVLVPRPETELLVDWACELLSGRMGSLRIAEVGTGSGCVSIAIALELPGAEIHATDISPDALDVAAANVRRHHLQDRIHLHEGDLLDPLSGLFDLILCNPPYVARGDPRIDPDVATHEPDVALFDHLDGDGLGTHRRLALGAGGILSDSGSLLVEVAEDQAAAARDLFQAAGWRSEVRRDLAGIERALRLHRAVTARE